MSKEISEEQKRHNKFNNTVEKIYQWYGIAFIFGFGTWVLGYFTHAILEHFENTYQPLLDFLEILMIAGFGSAIFMFTIGVFLLGYNGVMYLSKNLTSSIFS